MLDATAAATTLRSIGLLLLALLGQALLFGGRASADHLHYIPLNNDPVYNPRIVDVVGPGQSPLLEWIISTGTSDPNYFERDGFEVVYTRPEQVPISDTVSVFDFPYFESDDSRTTAFFEVEFSDLAARDDASIEIGFTDLINFIRWSESQQTIRSDIDATIVSPTPRWLSLGSLPFKVEFYYHFEDFTFTAFVVDQALGRSAPITWQGTVNPFVNFYNDGIGGTDPDHLDIYPFVSCQVDCALTVLSVDSLTCDTESGAVDPETCGPSTDLEITIDDMQETAVPGESVIYSISATNLGVEDVQGAEVTSAFPTSLDCEWECFGTNGASCPADGMDDIDAAVDLPVGGAAHFTATCAIDPGATGTLLTEASILASAGADPDGTNNTDSDADVLEPMVDLEIHKSDGASVAVPGGAVVYTIVAGNPEGPSDAAAASVTDVLPAGLEGCGWFCSDELGGECSASGLGDLDDVVSLPVGTSVTYSLFCTVAQGLTSPLSNTVTIQPMLDATDYAPGNNDSTDTNGIFQVADLWVTSTDGLGEVVPGDPVTYTIEVGNHGPSGAVGVVVENALPPELTGCVWSCSAVPGASCTSVLVVGAVNDTIALPAGKQVTYELSCTVDLLSSFDFIANQFTVEPSAGVSDPDPANNTSTDVDRDAQLIFRDGFETGDDSEWAAP